MTQTQLSSMTKEQLIALVTQQNQAKVRFSVSDAGYVNVTGLPGHNWKGFGATVEGWDVLLTQTDALKAFLAANRDIAAAKQAAWRSSKPLN